MPKKKLETIIPNFPGFYESVFENDIDQYFIDEEISYRYGEISEEIKEKFYDKLWETFDSDKYQKAVGQVYTQAFENEMSQYLFPELKLEYVGIDSPKEYNFRTDELVVNLVGVSHKFIKDRLIPKLKENQDKIAPIITERYSNRDGFYSFMDNSFNGWLQKLRAREYDQRYVMGAIYMLMELENQSLDEDCVYWTLDKHDDTSPIWYVDFKKVGDDLGLVEIERE